MVTLLDLIEAFDKRPLSVPVFFAVKLSSFYFLSNLSLMMLQTDFFLLNIVASTVSLDKNLAYKGILAIFLLDLGLIPSLASCSQILVWDVSGSLKANIFSRLIRF